MQPERLVSAPACRRCFSAELLAEAALPKGIRRGARYGLGEYRADGPNELGRVAFMQAIRRLAPQVLADLFTIETQLTGGVDDRLRAWGARWHLRDDWILAIARSTLQFRA